MSSTTLQTFNFEALNSRSSIECQSNPHKTLKARITHLLLVLEVWDGKPTYGKSWAMNLLVWMESFSAVGFDLGLLLQGQTRIAKLKSAYNSLIIGPRGLGW